MIGMTRLHTSTVLLLVVLFLHHTWLGAAQQMMPFPGQGQEPEDPTTVFVSTYIDRLMYIDDKNYEFQVSADATAAMIAWCWAVGGGTPSHQQMVFCNRKWGSHRNQLLIAHGTAAHESVCGPWTSLAPTAKHSQQIIAHQHVEACMHVSLSLGRMRICHQVYCCNAKHALPATALIMQALVFVYLSWSDPRARKAVVDNAARLKANSSESCKMQCQLYPKDQPDPTQGCCDNVWVSM
jgi:hypothetical protein